MSVVSRVDAFQRRHPALGYPLGVVYKFFEDQGAYLAALITYYGFLSMFPMLLLLVTVLGFVLSGDPALQREIIDSALGQFPVLKGDISEPDRLGGGTTGLVIGIAGALYGALGVGLALQNAVNTAWNIPRNERPNPIAARLRSLLLIVTAGLFVVATTALTATTDVVARWLGGSDEAGFVQLWGTRALSVVLATAGFAVAFRLAAAHRPAFRTVLPGAVVMALVWQTLQVQGTALVNGVASGSSATNTVFAVVLSLIVFLFVAACALVMCVEADVVRHRHLHPRALLTPLTDAVELTEADERAYTGIAQAQRHKGFEKVVVSFEKSPEPEGPSQESAGREGRGAGEDVLDPVARPEQP